MIPSDRNILQPILIMKGQSHISRIMHNSIRPLIHDFIETHITFTKRQNHILYQSISSSIRYVFLHFDHHFIDFLFDAIAGSKRFECLDRSYIAHPCFLIFWIFIGVLFPLAGLILNHRNLRRNRVWHPDRFFLRINLFAVKTQHNK